jgi:hypothetical protein
MEGLLIYMFYAIGFFTVLAVIGKIFKAIDKRASGKPAWEATKKKGKEVEFQFMELLAYLFVGLIVLSLLWQLVMLFTRGPDIDDLSDPPRGMGR